MEWLALLLASPAAILYWFSETKNTKLTPVLLYTISMVIALTIWGLTANNASLYWVEVIKPVVIVAALYVALDRFFYFLRKGLNI